MSGRRDYDPTGDALGDAADAVSRRIADSRVTTIAYRGLERIIEALRHEQEQRHGCIRGRRELAQKLRRLAMWIEKNPPRHRNNHSNGQAHAEA